MSRLITATDVEITRPRTLDQTPDVLGRDRKVIPAGCFQMVFAYCFPRTCEATLGGVWRRPAERCFFDSAHGCHQKTNTDCTSRSGGGTLGDPWVRWGITSPDNQCGHQCERRGNPVLFQEQGWVDQGSSAMAIGADRTCTRHLACETGGQRFPDNRTSSGSPATTCR